MVKKHYQLPLQKYLNVGVSLLISLAVAAFLLIPTKSYLELFDRQTRNYSLDIARQINNNVSDTISELDLKTKNLADELTESMDSAKHMSHTEQNQLLETLISKHFRSSTYYRALEHYYLRSVEYYRRDSSEPVVFGKQNSSLKQPFESAEYHSALEYPLNLRWVDYKPESDYINTARIIYDEDSFEITGLLVIRLSREYLLDKVKSLNEFEIGKLFIVDETRYVLCAKDVSHMGRTLAFDYVQHFNGSAGSFEMTDDIVTFYTFQDLVEVFPYHNWTTVISIKKDVLYHDFNSILFFSVLTAFAIIVLGILCVKQFSNLITRPTQSLINAMNSVHDGRFDIALSEQVYIQEFAFLNSSFNHMSHRLNDMVNRVLRGELAVKDMQIKNLQAQINPHFLFNTLQLISWKAKQYEADDVCDMIYSLSYMLEQNLANSNEKFITLRDELKYIEHYKLIIENKYDGQIGIQCNIPEALLDILIPMLILQPFVENAVVHGLANKPGHGHIQVTAVAEGELIAFYIIDNGMGMLSSNLNEIIESNEKKGHHIALSNIQRRIHLLYGEAYGFTIESRLYEGTTIRMAIPMRMEGYSNAESDDC